MRIRIEHSTIYRYQRPLTFGRHRLVLRPRESHDLRIESMRLDLQPVYRLTWVRDVFGNSVALVDWLTPADTLSITTDITVERTAPFPSRQTYVPALATFPPAYHEYELAITSAYQRLSYANDEWIVRGWLNEHFWQRTGDAESIVHALGRLVHDRISYVRRSEHGVQSPAVTLERQSGSCRDLATLMMECARVLGIAARFASGYLHGTASMAGHASTHAWCEVYLPLLGWRGFDPTIGDATSLRHVVAGVSEHPRGVMPVSGSFHGVRADCLSMTATVKTTELPSEVDSSPE